MKVVLIASIGLAALFILAPNVKAQEHQIQVILVQTVKPITQTYSGVKADVLGIRIGMTVAQAEAIAAKTYSSKPAETKDSLSVNYHGIFAQSQSFISKAVFRNGTADVLTLYFSNPTTGNVVYGLSRNILFNASRQPLMTVVTSDLIKKYGPPSSKSSSPYMWQFGEQSRKPIMEITAYPFPTSNHTKVQFIDMTMEDYQLTSESTTEGVKQLQSAVDLVAPTRLLTGTTYVLTDAYVAAGGKTPVGSSCKAAPHTGVPKAVALGCTLVQTAKPPTRAYRGVDLSLLGIRTGMTVSQVEAIAAKLNLGKPDIKTAHPDDSVITRKATASVEGAYIHRISYTSRTQAVMVYFSSPATGNRSEAVYVGNNYTVDRKIKRPLTKAVMMKLTGQYGPTSAHRPDIWSQYLCWNFGGQSLLKSSDTQSCYPDSDHIVGTDVADDFKQRGPQPAEVYMFALLSTNQGKVNQFMQGLGDFGLADLDRSEIVKQLISGAEKYNQQAKVSAGATK